MHSAEHIEITAAICSIGKVAARALAQIADNPGNHNITLEMFMGK